MYYGFYDIFTRTNLKKKKKGWKSCCFPYKNGHYLSHEHASAAHETRTRHIWLETNWTHLIFDWTCFKYCEGKVKIC